MRVVPAQWQELIGPRVSVQPDECRDDRVKQDAAVDASAEIDAGDVWVVRWVERSVTEASDVGAVERISLEHLVNNLCWKYWDREGEERGGTRSGQDKMLIGNCRPFFPYKIQKPFTSYVPSDWAKVSVVVSRAGNNSRRTPVASSHCISEPFLLSTDRITVAKECCLRWLLCTQ